MVAKWTFLQLANFSHIFGICAYISCTFLQISIFCTFYVDTAEFQHPGVPEFPAQGIRSRLNFKTPLGRVLLGRHSKGPSAALGQGTLRSSGLIGLGDVHFIAVAGLLSKKRFRGGHITAFFPSLLCLTRFSPQCKVGLQKAFQAWHGRYSLGQQFQHLTVRHSKVDMGGCFPPWNHG